MNFRQTVASFVDNRAPWARRAYARRQQKRWLAKPMQTEVGLFYGPSTFANFEPDVRRTFIEALDDCDIFVDVGANVGFYSCFAKRYRKDVVAIEPQSNNLAILRRNLSVNGFDDVIILPFAAGDHSCQVNIYGFCDIASLHPSWSSGAAAYCETVTMKTLDEMVLVRTAGKRVLIKIDVEGAEAIALRGAKGLLTSTPRPVWLVEAMHCSPLTGKVDTDFDKTMRTFKNCGYSLTQINDAMFLFR